MISCSQMSSEESGVFLVQDHTSRLKSLEQSLQQTLPIISSVQTLTMGIRDSLEELKVDIKEVKYGHEAINLKLVGFDNRVLVLEAKDLYRADRRKAIRNAVLGSIGTVLAAAVVWLFGFK
jgi:hypothetical protein